MKKAYKFCMWCFIITYIPLVIIITLTKPLYMQNELLQGFVILTLTVFYVMGVLSFVVALKQEDDSSKYWELRDKLEIQIEMYESIRTKLVTYIIKEIDKEFKNEKSNL